MYVFMLDICSEEDCWSQCHANGHLHVFHILSQTAFESPKRHTSLPVLFFFPN